MKAAEAAADGVPGQGDQRIKLAVSLLDGPQVVEEALPESGSSLLGHEVGTSDERCFGTALLLLGFICCGLPFGNV